MSRDDNADERPRDLDAEQAVLGACLQSTDAVAVAAETLTEEDFYRPAHATLFDVLVGQWEAGLPTDQVSIGAALEQRDLLLRIGGVTFLHSLVANTPIAVNVGYWADIVADHASRARVLDLSVHLRQLAVRPGSRTTPELQERVRELADSATTSRRASIDDGGAWVGDFIDDHIAAWDRPDPGGIPVPYRDLEDVIKALRPGQMVIVAGRPGAGKTVIATDWAEHAASRGFSVMMASLEMSRGGILNRLLAARASVRVNSIENRTLTEQDRYAVEEARDHIAKLPLRIVDKFSTSLGRIREQARQQARSEHGLDLLIVDYVQLLEGDASKSDQERISGHSRGLKLLAAELGIPVIVVAQLNRGPEQRQDKVPFMSELKGSGSLEQDADMVILVHRPDSYDREVARAGEADLILAKHRNGPIATIAVAHQLHFSRFVDLARGAW